MTVIVAVICLRIVQLYFISGYKGTSVKLANSEVVAKIIFWKQKKTVASFSTKFDLDFQMIALNVHL